MDFELIFVGVGGLIWASYGFAKLLRKDRIAEANRAQVTEGREEFFEQRRSWRTYGYPPTTADAVAREARSSLAAGLATMAFAAVFMILQ